MNRMIEQQFSLRVAQAGTARVLDALAAELQSALFAYALPDPLLAMGLRIEGDGTPHGLMAAAHGTALHGRFDHVWLDYGESRRALAGRVRFFRLDRDGKDSDVVAYEVLVDGLGNMRLDNGAGFTDTMKGEPMMVKETFRRLALGLARAIHAGMDVVSAN